MITVDKDAIKKYIEQEKWEPPLTDADYERVYAAVDDAAHEACCETINDYMCDQQSGDVSEWEI